MSRSNSTGGGTGWPCRRATAGQETTDWIAAAMAGKKVKVGEKIAKAEKGQAGTA